MDRYDRFGTLPAGEVLPLIGPKQWKTLILGQLVNVSSVRLQMFTTKGCSCVRCGITGTFFAVERSFIQAETDKPYHVNLYALREDGKEILMTKDHIIPASLDGPDSLANMQPMCEPCNTNKGNYGEYERDHIRFSIDEVRAFYDSLQDKSEDDLVDITVKELRRLTVELLIRDRELRKEVSARKAANKERQSLVSECRRLKLQNE